MTEYVVLLPSAEAAWEAAGEEHRSAVYAEHTAFAKALAERGHTMTDGSERTHSRGARVVRNRGGEVVVTDGPYAETTEQLTGFYVVETDDLDDLLQVCGLLAGVGGAIEVRESVDHSGGT